MLRPECCTAPMMMYSPDYEHTELTEPESMSMVTLVHDAITVMVVLVATAVHATVSRSGVGLWNALRHSIYTSAHQGHSAYGAFIQ